MITNRGPWPEAVPTRRGPCAWMAGSEPGHDKNWRARRRRFGVGGAAVV